MIVRSKQANDGRRVVTVEGEAIQYTDVVASGNAAAVESAAAAQGFSTGRGCGTPSLLSVTDASTLYQAKCPSGATLIVECRATACNARN